jgi:predicted DCC family thiol-disulfide oxidoreductase YuxK
MNPTHPHPFRPVLIFDGDCRFCCHFIRRLSAITGDRVEYLPQQDPGCPGRFPTLAPADLEESVHRVDTQGRITSGAKAVAQTLAESPDWRWAWILFRAVPGLAPIAEWLYRKVANNRAFISRVWQRIYGDFDKLPPENRR